MSNDWDQSAPAWIASMGEHGDWGRQHVLDPVMLGRLADRQFSQALDVGCGEGRFCRLLKQRGISAIGIDPTRPLLEEARKRDPSGDYRFGNAERLDFESSSFDLVISYLSLIDIADFRAAIREMARVLRPNGTLLVANLNSFFTSCLAQGWIREADGRRVHYPVDRYLDEFSNWVEWADIRVENWHRPLGAYMRAFFDNGLQLTFFDEPEPASSGGSRIADYRRAPYYLMMEWTRPDTSRK